MVNLFVDMGGVGFGSRFSSVQFNNLFKLKQSHMMYILYLSGDNSHYKIKCDMRHNAP